MRKLSPLFIGLLFLFLFQLITDFFESIYAFGLLVTRFTPETVSLFLIFAPLLLLFFRAGVKRPVLIGLVCLALIARAVEPILPLGGRLVFSSLGMAALLIFFPAWLAGRKAGQGASLAPGLGLAVLLSIVLRADVMIYAIGIYDRYASATEERLGPRLLSEITELTGGRA